MAGYLTHLHVLMEAEKWLQELERALRDKKNRLERQRKQLTEIEQSFLDLAARSREHLSAGQAAGREFPGANIENGVGRGLSKYASVGAIGPDIPSAANILALNQRWVGETMHKGSPRRAWVRAGSTQFVTHFLDTVNGRNPAPARRKALTAYLLGHVSSIAAHVLLHPFINSLAWEKPDAKLRAGDRLQIEIALDAQLAKGYFQRDDLHSGQSWEDYFLDKGDYSSEIQELMNFFLDAYKLTYGGDRPQEVLCARPPDQCKVPKLDVAFLVDGYRNTTNWALDVGYDQSPHLFRFLHALAMLAGGCIVLVSTWSAAESFSTLGNFIFKWEQPDNDQVKQTNLTKWKEKGFFENERILLDCLDNALSWGGYIFIPTVFLATGFIPPVSFFWDGIFGQGTTSFFHQPGGVITFKILKYAYLISMFGANEAEPQIWQEWYVHLPRLLLNILLDALDAPLISKRSEEKGVEGDLLGLGTFKLKWVVTAFYLFSAVLAFSIKSIRKNDDGSRETGYSVWDFLIGLSFTIIGIGMIGWWWKLFDRWMIEEVIAAPWPSEDTQIISDYLGIEQNPKRLVEGTRRFPVRLFPPDKIRTVEGKDAFPQNEDEATPWSDRPNRDEQARKANSIQEGEYSLKNLLEKAAHFSSLLAVAAANYDQVPAAQKDKAKRIFKDWNLDYRTVAEWRDLMDTSDDQPGLIRAAELWLEDLKQNRDSRRTTMARIMEVLGEQTVGVKLKGKLLDANPLNPATPEPLPNVQIRTRAQSTNSNNAGEFELEFALVLGDQTLEIGQPGVDRLSLTVRITGDPAGPLTVVVRDPQAAELVQVTQPAPVDISTVIQVNLPDLNLVVHKIRGTVRWPDSRVLGDPNYQGTGLSGKRVYALPLADGPIPAQRPVDTRAWSEWKSRPGVLSSAQPGRFAQAERTDQDGAFEIKFIDLSPGKRYFLWVEGLDPDSGADSPEYCVRTIYRELRHLTGSRAHLAATLGYHLIDHTYNLTQDAVTWGVESLKIVNLPGGAGGGEVRAVRPQRDAKGDFENQNAAGERVSFDPAKKIISNYHLKCLPLLPVYEPFDRQSDPARQAQAGLMEALDTRFNRGHYGGEVRFVLDARRIVQAINLQAGAWDGAWSPANVNQSRNRRLCELLEKTFVVSPQIPSANIRNVDDAHWRFDAITLADFALISIPIPPPINQAVAANRQLDSTWVPVLQPALPRLTGLSAGRHLFLAPGHGFFDDHPPSNALADWRSERGGYNAMAGEDENDAYMAAEVNRIVRRQGMLVTNVREVEDFTAPGVVHPANNVFNPSNNPDFLRLWQQNPMYYLGSQGNPVIVGPGSNLGNLAGNHNDKGIGARWNLAVSVAGGANPIDIFLAIHTNASNGNARGVSAIYLDVNAAVGNPNEVNNLGQSFATRLRDNLVTQVHINQRPVVSVHQLGNPIADLQRTFDHWTQTQAGTSAVWPRVLAAPLVPAGWQHRTFPRTIPAALVEVAFHDNVEDAALLSRAWFRRKAGEAMSVAVEEQLRENPDAVTQAGLVRMLKANFGPTAAILGLPNGNAALTANDLRAAIQTATGEAVNVPAANLNAAVTAVEAVRSRHTRQMFITGLRDAFAERAGYTAGSGEIDPFVTATILSGGTLANLSRPNAPVSRSEAGSLIATALGWTPASLGTVIGRQIDGRTLMRPLGGMEEPLLFIPTLEAQAIFTAIRAIDPRQIFRLVDLYLTDEQSNRLERQDGRPPQYSLQSGQRIRLAVDTQGIPWQVALANNVEFTLSNSSGFRLTLAGDQRTRQRLSSRVWEVNLPVNGIYRIDVTVRHFTQADRHLTLAKLYNLVESS